MKNIDEVRTVLELERIEDNLYRGQNYKSPWGRVFGGQVLAQSIYAAQLTAPRDRTLHSMHAYFILAGNIDIPIVYDVEHTRDGGSYTTRQVKAIQNGQPIFTMQASFQSDEANFDHQLPMPDVPGPEGLLTDQQIGVELKDRIPELHRLTLLDRPIECRPTIGVERYTAASSEPEQHIWIKAKGTLPDSYRLHQAALAYVSDYNLLATGLFPHWTKASKKGVFMASLDHAMWFHREFRFDDWMLYSIESPNASGGRGYSRGNIFTRDGTLVASVAQEGMIRTKRQ